jgi:hypothetical protein
MLLGFIAVVLGIIAIFARLEIGITGNNAMYLSGLFGKTSVVTGVAWLAWPQILWLQRTPGGTIAVVAFLVIALAFIARPRLLLYVVPMILGATALLIGLTWVQRFLSPPK